FTVLGGTGFFFGPIIGAVLMVLAQVLFSELTRAWWLYLGLAFLLTVLLAPAGLAGWLVQLRQVLRGPWRQLLPALPGVLAAWLLIGVGAAVLLEMLYHRQLDTAMGPGLVFLGLPLHVAQASSWVGAGAVLVAGLVLLRTQLPGWQRRWDAVQQLIDASARARGRP
ncbi:MAG: branched-chain amino acid ABC transporter permease, partial [Rhodoferax sp.]|nr:branched-chain amino acid ABC transporter permease [Rhodoferax sp.]